MEKINKIYEKMCNTHSDINEHLPTIKKYSEECNYIIEMGVRSIVSTWAIIAAHPKKVISIDLKHPSFYKNHNFAEYDLETVYELTAENNINFNFLLADTLNVTIEECDLLFIDTLHTYNQLCLELKKHSNKVKKYIILHDTETYKNTGEDNSDKGLFDAIELFLQENEEWEIKEIYKNNNGLTILKRNL